MEWLTNMVLAMMIAHICVLIVFTGVLFLLSGAGSPTREEIERQVTQRLLRECPSCARLQDAVLHKSQTQER